MKKVVVVEMVQSLNDVLGNPLFVLEVALLEKQFEFKVKWHDCGDFVRIRLVFLV